MEIPQEIKDLIQSGCHAHLVTLNLDGISGPRGENPTATS